MENIDEKSQNCLPLPNLPTADQDMQSIMSQGSNYMSSAFYNMYAQPPNYPTYMSMYPYAAPWCYPSFPGQSMTNPLNDARLNSMSTGSSYSKDKKSRVIFAREQIEALMYRFNQNPNIRLPERNIFAQQLGLTGEQVKIWFQNRRYKLRKQKVQDDSFTVPECPQSRENTGDSGESEEADTDESTQSYTPSSSSGALSDPMFPPAAQSMPGTKPLDVTSMSQPFLYPMTFPSWNTASPPFQDKTNTPNATQVQFHPFTFPY